MAVIIEGIEMPVRCEECRFYDKLVGGCDLMHYFTLRHYGQEKPDWCPLKEVKENETD